jgi:hypothetical protein
LVEGNTDGSSDVYGTVHLLRQSKAGPGRCCEPGAAEKLEIGGAKGMQAKKLGEFDEAAE